MLGSVASVLNRLRCSRMVDRIVTIDGPAGSGKGTVGQRLALHLGWRFLDSGALYRACAYFVSQKGVSLADSATVVKHLKDIEFESIPTEQGEEATVFLNGAEVGANIRTSECGQMASKLAADREVRKSLLDIQRNYYHPPGLVADGRDMGSVVFPDALLKVFLTASLEVRAERKFKQLKAKEISLKYDKIYREIENRDFRDSTRSHAPLATPHGALVVDTSSLNVDDVLRLVLEGVRKNLKIFESEAQ